MDPRFYQTLLTVDPAAAGDSRETTCVLLELPTMGYEKVWRLQQELVALKAGRPQTADVVLLCDHSPVFTLGRNARREHLKISPSRLNADKIPLVRVERGGEITYHGPGQLIGYPIIDLRRAGLRVVDYVGCLEDIMIRTARNWGVAACRNPVNRGVWVGERKLGSVGIAVRHGISYHGFALNVTTDLKPFEWINPCGLDGIGVTSLALETVEDISGPAVREELKRHLAEVLKIKLKQTTVERNGKNAKSSAEKTADGLDTDGAGVFGGGIGSLRR